MVNSRRGNSHKKNRKQTPSRKLGAENYCLAHISTTEEVSSGKVSIMYCSTHTNHEINLEECKNLPFPRSVVEQVKTMFASGVQIEKIIDGQFTFIELASGSEPT